MDAMLSLLETVFSVSASVNSSINLMKPIPRVDGSGFAGTETGQATLPLVGLELLFRMLFPAGVIFRPPLPEYGTENNRQSADRCHFRNFLGGFVHVADGTTRLEIDFRIVDEPPYGSGTVLDLL